MTTPNAPISPFVSATELAARLIGPDAPALLFVAAEPGAAEGLIPGSVPTDLPTHYAGAGGGARGRLPLPERGAVHAWLTQAGIVEDAPIVVYDAGTGTSAARAWWVLSWAGRRGVRILDGGLKAWQDRGAHADALSAAATTDASAPRLAEIGTEQIARDPSAYRLVDARGKAAFEGSGEAPSHLPGAVNSPAAQWQDAEGRLLPLDERRARAEALGLLADGRPVVAYCGSGVAAAYLIAAVQDLGVEASLYAGSWSAWSAAKSDTTVQSASA
ncbi:sulfurtransferase [Verticiella sediminum]|uniref:Sulfurtransferase n=1 Tax=Verticiella sediminum TaxID=1247510 RepID=A0A556ACZ0_9BURK|nr:rhodanese-like domain-containing protein [Verticiella sediminum]TSH90733.1 sulfurtransferase [Verticiella sediminum]